MLVYFSSETPRRGRIGVQILISHHVLGTWCLTQCNWCIRNILVLVIHWHQAVTYLFAIEIWKDLLYWMELVVALALCVYHVLTCLMTWQFFLWNLWEVSDCMMLLPCDKSLRWFLCDRRFVEIMAPVFSRTAWRCVWHMIQVRCLGKGRLLANKVASRCG